MPGFLVGVGRRTLNLGRGIRVDAFRRTRWRFTAWYLAAGQVVGVFTHDVDQDYERGRELVEGSAAAVDV